MSEIFYKAIFNPIRLKIITCLSKKDLTVNELIKNCGLSQSAVSQHLSILKASSLVDCSKKGREVTYRLINKKANKIAETVFDLSKELK